MEFLTAKDVEKILRVAYKTSVRDHLMLLLSFRHGLRASEVAALTLADVADGKIHAVRRKNSLETIQPLAASDNLLLDEPSALAAWLKERPQSTEALFPSRKGAEHLNRKQVWRIESYYMREAGMPKELCHPHSLKHALASTMIRQGVGIEYVKEALGHRAISSTIIYTHITQSEAMDKAQKAIQEALQ